MVDDLSLTFLSNSKQSRRKPCGNKNSLTLSKEQILLTHILLSSKSFKE
ncbi:16497_t:CDS:1, partial [Cetraspora pellucida]